MTARTLPSTSTASAEHEAHLVACRVCVARLDGNGGVVPVLQCRQAKALAYAADWDAWVAAEASRLLAELVG